MTLLVGSGAAHQLLQVPFARPGLCRHVHPQHYHANSGSESWQGSPEVRDLIHRLLRPNPAERLTMAEVFAHPWFQVSVVDSDPEQMIFDGVWAHQIIQAGAVPQPGLCTVRRNCTQAGEAAVRSITPEVAQPRGRGLALVLDRSCALRRRRPQQLACCFVQMDLADGALQLNDTLLAAVGADYAASGDLQVRAALC